MSPYICDMQAVPWVCKTESIPDMQAMSCVYKSESISIVEPYPVYVSLGPFPAISCHLIVKIMSCCTVTGNNLAVNLHDARSNFCCIGTDLESCGGLARILTRVSEGQLQILKCDIAEMAI